MSDEIFGLDRRAFLGVTFGAAAVIGAASTWSRAAQAQSDPTRTPPGERSAGGGPNFAPLRAEVEVRDCEVDGEIPEDLNGGFRSEEHTSELQSRENLVCRLLL